MSNRCNKRLARKRAVVEARAKRLAEDGIPDAVYAAVVRCAVRQWSVPTDVARQAIERHLPKETP